MVFDNARNLILSCSVVLLALMFGLVLSGLFIEPSVPVAIFLILLPVIAYSLTKPKFPIVLLLLTVMFTEFYWIEIMGGYLKPFHLASALVLVTFSVFHLQALKRSQVFWLFTFFVTVCMAGAAFAEDWRDSLRSFVLPLILLSIAINVAIALKRGKISEGTFANIMLFGGLITVAFAVVQMVSYSLTGFLMTLTETQDGQIIIAKRPPSFFTEADTFGKFLAFSFLFALPFALDRQKSLHKYARAIVIAMFVGIFLNMTRSAIIGIGIAGLIYTFYLLKTRNLKKNIAIFTMVGIVLLMAMPTILGLTQTVGSHEEMKYRFQTFVNPSAALEDQSISYRKKGIEETLDGSVESLEAFLAGHGWGASIIQSRGEPHDVGGSLLINILYYGGIFAFAIFVLICYRIIQISLRMAKRENDEILRLFAEGTFLSFIGMLLISQLASMWIAPEFWVAIGCAIYLELEYKKNENSSRA